MAMSNKERQALFQQRRKERIEKCVTADDVVQAARLLWETYAADPLNQIQDTWEDFVARCRSRRGSASWLELLPDSAEPTDYPDDLNEADRALLARVGAVVRSIKLPPGN